MASLLRRAYVARSNSIVCPNLSVSYDGPVISSFQVQCFFTNHVHRPASPVVLRRRRARSAWTLARVQSAITVHTAEEAYQQEKNPLLHWWPLFGSNFSAKFSPFHPLRAWQNALALFVVSSFFLCISHSKVLHTFESTAETQPIFALKLVFVLYFEFFFAT